MVVVLGYNNNESEILNKIFEKHNIAYKYSLLEPKILSAEKIILPPPINFVSVYRKLNMMNLFSVLRMIKKPILGINDGCKLMCNQLIDKNKCGLGFFDVKINIEDDKNISLVEETGKINFNNSTKLLSKKYENQSVRFYPQIQPSLYLDSNAEITVAENKYSFLYESKNHYGLILDGDKNEEIFNEVVKNFLFI